MARRGLGRCRVGEKDAFLEHSHSVETNQGPTLGQSNVKKRLPVFKCGSGGVKTSNTFADFAKVIDGLRVSLETAWPMLPNFSCVAD